MSPDDIPASVTKLCASAPWIIPKSPGQAAYLLAHFWPAIEQRIREQVAREIEQLILPATNDAAQIRNGGIEHAAHTARNGAAK
ncbi:hypothetical protein OG455_41560 [Kitasatospora sp. NBC_01287]|uniref:hypothetical protein n=1 Tax=Kitasatospora sp. NBC_01287 TaxID=2903573 RepID=UPI002251D3C9|nr:hypothetical protein [Kitasatospora sp. NBC_01287]MCX4750972.1 hypothetical protein [Kitasatospora sp. NBC_01287]MCX4751777.1 hypothetical protein [Kitasatospora sp. NBC_01287]MCX4751931.1 hypothetical protein [Kitasatospora sp. NBC_01287]